MDAHGRQPLVRQGMRRRLLLEVNVRLLPFDSSGFSRHRLIMRQGQTGALANPRLHCIRPHRRDFHHRRLPSPFWVSAHVEILADLPRPGHLPTYQFQTLRSLGPDPGCSYGSVLGLYPTAGLSP